jgi:Skp family chaperone for outer membrane proteins
MVAALALALGACSPVRVAVVDSERILRESVRALSYQQQLGEREKAMALDLQFLAGSLPAADFQARRNQYLKELQQMKAELEERLNKEVRETTGQIVKEKGLRATVIVKNPVLFSLPGRTVDITDEVIARLR